EGFEQFHTRSTAASHRSLVGLHPAGRLRAASNLLARRALYREGVVLHPPPRPGRRPWAGRVDQASRPELSAQIRLVRSRPFRARIRPARTCWRVIMPIGVRCSLAAAMGIPPDVALVRPPQIADSRW